MEIMSELSRQQKAAITKRGNTRSTFLNVAEITFADSNYRGVRVEQITGHANLSTATFYTMFSGEALGHPPSSIRT
jgi:hypothetical protein